MTSKATILAHRKGGPGCCSFNLCRVEADHRQRSDGVLTAIAVAPQTTVLVPSR